LGFIKLWGLPLQTQARIQMLPQGEEPMSLPNVSME
jgi:hypothetical protein